MERWVAAFMERPRRAIAAANASEPALDVTVKNDPDALWAERLGGSVLPTGSVRLIAHGTVTALLGFAEGVWWVQDAAAALLVWLLGDVAGPRVADLCGAGGKAARRPPAHTSPRSIASPARLARLEENLKRLSLTAALVCAAPEGRARSMRCWSMPPARPAHPAPSDVPWLKQPADVETHRACRAG
jgi:16S rRNA (cytosine967-C5)-methyltransferase